MAGIVDLHGHFWIADHVVVDAAKKRFGGTWHLCLDLADRLRSNGGIDAHAPCRNSGATADDEHAPGDFGNQCRQMAEHSLEPHVLRFPRGLHLAGVVVVERAISGAGDG